MCTQTRRGSAGSKRLRGRRGQAVIEFSLVAPWLLFLFIGTVDAGFSLYALTAVEGAARSAALYTSSSTATATDATTACATYVLPELKYLPNVGNTVASCAALPVTVTVQSVTGPDSVPASQVLVQYQTPRLAPIPGLFGGQMTLRRTVTMRVKT